MCFWLYSSGSTGKPKGAVHIHADLRLTDELYAGPVLGITENDVFYSVAKLFFAYGLGNALTFPLAVGATSVLLAGAADAGGGRRAAASEHPVTVFYGVPTFYAAFLASPAAPATRRGQAAPLRFGRRGAAAGYRPALARALRRRHSRRHRLDRDAAHLSQQPAGDVRYGTTGKPMPGYEMQARRRGRRGGRSAGRDGRTAGARARPAP